MFAAPFPSCPLELPARLSDRLTSPFPPAEKCHSSETSRFRNVRLGDMSMTAQIRNPPFTPPQTVPPTLTLPSPCVSRQRNLLFLCKKEYFLFLPEWYVPSPLPIPRESVSFRGFLVCEYTNVSLLPVPRGVHGKRCSPPFNKRRGVRFSRRFNF